MTGWVLRISLAFSIILMKSWEDIFPYLFRKFLNNSQLIISLLKRRLEERGLWGGRGKLFIIRVYLGSFSTSIYNIEIYAKTNFILISLFQSPHSAPNSFNSNTNLKASN